MAKDSLEVMVARIDENIKTLVNERIADRKALDDHIKKDEQIVAEYIKPLYNVYQQGLGASRSRTMTAAAMDKAATVGLSVAGAWAALRGLK